MTRREKEIELDFGDEGNRIPEDDTSVSRWGLFWVVLVEFAKGNGSAVIVCW